VPSTVLTVTSQGNNAQGAPSYDVSWIATDEDSGVKSVTVYVAENGGDFKIWLRQVNPSKTQAIFTGETGKRYEFLAVATDKSGNRETASIANAVLPDDGSRQEILDSLGVNQSLSQTAEFPLAAADRSYAVNALFQQAGSQLPGHVAATQKSDLRSVLAPFALRGFADGYQASAADIGALAMIELADHSVLASAGSLRNEVFHYSKDGGRSTTPLFTLESPVLDMAVDQLGQLWVMTGAELLQVDANTGEVLQRLSGPGQDPVTHALAIQPTTGDIYVSSGNGIEIFHPGETDAAKAWRHFSNQRVGDLAFAPDGRLWAVTWTGSEVTSAQPNPTTDIVSFPMNGRTAGRPELEYRLSGVIDSIAFGDDGTPLAGLLIASCNLQQRPVSNAQAAVPHQASVWMVQLADKRILQLADGGTRGESIITTADGRILIAQTGHIDVIAPRKAPVVKAITVPDGALVSLPMAQIGVVFDQDMWTGEPGTETADLASVLNPANFTLTVTSTGLSTGLGANAGAVITPQNIRWDAATRTAWIDVQGLEAGQYQLNISSTLQNSAEIRLEQGTISTFTALLDMTGQVQLEFSNTRADRVTGAVSYDVSLTNIGADDLKGPLTLLLDPGRYFGDSIDSADIGGGDQSDLWTIDLSSALLASGGKFAAGATITGQTITVTPASLFATRAGMADLVKFNLGHGVYAVPQENLPPSLSVAGLIDADTLAAATVGQAWTGQIEAIDPDGTVFYWELMQAPAGVTLTPPTDILSADDGYHAVATLNWTPSALADANSDIIVRVQDSRGGVATRKFQLPVIGGNNAPVVDVIGDITLKEGEALILPIIAADADGDALTLVIRNLPAGTVFDAASGILSWTPGYDQAGVYQNITVVAGDGITTSSRHFNLIVAQGYAKPVLASVAQQTLREGERYALQLAGHAAGSEALADGTAVTLEYSAPWLPGGAKLNTETGWLEWTPDYNQHGAFRIPVTLTATWTTPGNDPVITSVTKDVVLNVLNANGAPVFDASASLSTGAAETWNILEGQTLQISAFAFDPDNPDFEPRIRFQAGAAASGPETTAATVSYDVSGLPDGATFDPETLEIRWTPGFAQAGTYSITVTATDDGDPLRLDSGQASTSSGQAPGVPAVSHLVLPIVVGNANRAPDIGDISNAFVDKGSVIEIPVSALDADGNPIQISISGLPRFATYTQNPSSNGTASGVIRFAPGANDRGDYTITVVAQDNGDPSTGSGPTANNNVLTQAKSFVLTVRSETEAPVITAPRQVVAVVGQPLSVALLANDRDQDALTWSANGLPIGAEILAAIQYGHATLAWTPTAADIGSRDIELVVTDSGLAPENAGYVQPENPTSNVTKHTLRVVVRAANAAPEVLGVQVNGSQIVDTGVTAPIQLNASEGVPLTIELFGRDTDADLIEWAATGLPRGMTLDVPNAGNGKLAVLRWTPDLFAAQDSNTGSAGQWRFSVRGSDGSAQFERSFEINVANVNQTPRLLPMPLQLVNEGQTVNFTLRSFDADNDAVGMSLIYGNSSPSGVVFDSATGYFEWTPDQSVVNGAIENDHPYSFTFQATDGSATTTQSVQVRVFDVNRLPQLTATNHALVIGQTLSLPVELGAASNGISATDPDGAEQTAALAVSFANLPEGAGYDAQTRRLNWVSGPGQIGDFTVTAQASDGKNTTSRTFTLRVVAEASANLPKITVSTTPSTPALPGQAVIASVRADAWSGIADIVAEVRGSGLGDVWQPVALDSAGRMKLLSTQPGLIEVRVTATDRDGFVSSQTHTVRIKNPADTAAPLLAWTDKLSGATTATKPVEISQITALKAGLVEQQLMGYKLQIAPAGRDAWQTLAEHDDAAIDIDQQLDLIGIDPAKFANGIYQLRLSAWDLVGRTTEIEARIIIDSAQKDLGRLTVTDNSYRLAGHTLTFNRSIDVTANNNQTGDLGNWQLALLDTGLTTDQPATTASGATASWQEGARVWLQIPENLSNPTANTLSLSFTLNTSSERLGEEPSAPQVFHPAFSDSQGWQLQAHTGSAQGAENLMRQGSHLYDQTTGLPWVPNAYTLIAPDGSRYDLGGDGLITAVTFQDGAQWLVSDAGIAAVNGDVTQRVEIQRDSQGRINRVTGPDAQGETASTVYRYDAQGRLALVRVLLQPPLPLGEGGGEGSALGTPLAYDSQGQLLTDAITAKLGAAVNWLGDSSANQWSGELTDNITTTLAFNVRESELASTVHTSGAQGAIVYALETELPEGASIEVTGATLIGNATVNGKNTLLVRVTEAGAKLIRINGAGAASLRISVAGDLNRDGNIDGADSQAWQQTALDSNPTGDLNGDGQTNAADRQLLYANYGFKANRAPAAVANLPQGKTHTDLATKMSVSAIAQDMEGDSVFLRVLNTTHGSAKLSRDGSSLIFTPEAGYAGQATITLQADDGYALGAPIELNVNVSGAALTSIRIANLADLINLQTGQSTRIHAVGDFTDEQDVDLTAGSGDYLTLNTLDLSPLGKVGAIAIAIDDARDLVSAKAAGAGLISLSRTATDAQQTYTIRTVAAINVAQAGQVDPQTGELIDTRASLTVTPDVYPGTLTLIPGSTRQLKVHVTDPNTGLNADVHEAGQTAFAGSPESTEDYVDPDTGEITTYVYAAIPAVFSGTRYSVSDDSIATVSDSGLITALRTGQVTVSVVHLGSVVDAYGSVSEQVIGQRDIQLSVQIAQTTDNDPATETPQTITVNAQEGAAISAETGETVLIGAGALKQDTPVSISRIDLTAIDPSTAIFAAQAGGLEVVGAFTLDVGSAGSAYPLQLAIPVQNGIAAQAGDEVWFLRKGKVLVEGSTATHLIYQDTWWVVDNGFISLDASGNAIAKTASPPYGGLDASGEYRVYKKLPGVISSPFELAVGIGDAMTFAGSVGLSMSFGGAALPLAITSDMIGIIAGMATMGTASSYHFGVPQFAKIDIPTVNEQPVINTSAKLPPVVTPYGNVVVPNITNAAVSDEGAVTITFENNNPGQLAGRIKLRALFANGTHIDLPEEIGGENTAPLTVDTSNLKTKDGKVFAVGSVSWQLVRIIDGHVLGDAPIEFAGNTARISPKADMAATLTRTGIEFFRENKTVSIAQVNLVNKIGSGQAIDFNNAYLTGNKVQPIAFSTDLSRAYVAGNGVIYEIDLLTFQLIDSIPIQGGKNIVSLASVGSLLIVGEGQSYGNGAGNNQLYAMDTNPGSSTYKTFKSIQGTGIVEQSKLGVAGMTVGSDGQTLIVAVPKAPNTVYLQNQDPGDILILDFKTFNFKTGVIAPPIQARLPNDSLSGKTPQVITATHDENRYLVANVSDYNRGLSTLTLTRDADGNITGAKLEAISLSQPDSKISIDRLDIQRAQSAVLVEQDGVEYAIVSDDNYHFLDPYWKAMYEAPTFVFTPSGPPLAVGGSASAKKVAVGGKLGIVKDPFGKQGSPEYLGATLPLDGYGIVNLSLSEDGKVLIGQLKGTYSGNILSEESLTQKPSQSHAWDVEALIAATLAQTDQDRLRKHISLTDTPNAEQSIANPGSEFKGTIGTAFDPEHVNVSVTGNMGDVIEVELKKIIAYALLKLPAPGTNLTQEQKDLIASKSEDIKSLMDNMHDFKFLPSDGELLTGEENVDTLTGNDQNRLKLITEKVGMETVVSSRTADSKSAKFIDEGRLYLVPQFTKEDLIALSKGDSVTQQKHVGFNISYTLSDKKGSTAKIAGQTQGLGTAVVSVTAKDYASTANAFIGDRPLDNPGYSTIKLIKNVGVNQGDLIDIYKVEQRLKYLGYSAVGDNNSATNEYDTIKVDGKFETKEGKALQLFEKIINYDASSIATSTYGTYNTATSVGKNSEALDWLNAYNAPHWIQFFNSIDSGYNTKNSKLNNWENLQTTADKNKVFGTSWMFDLMVAAGNNKSAGGKPLLFNGADDNTLPVKKSDIFNLGMKLDLGIHEANISADNQKKVDGNDKFLGLMNRDAADNLIPATTSIPDQTAYNSLKWSPANADYLSGLLFNANSTNTDGTHPDNSQGPNNQRDALRDFLTLYTATQKDPVTVANNGSWDEISFTGAGTVDATHSQAVIDANKETIRKALFGTGEQDTGLVNKNKLLIGGVGLGLGNQLTAETLSAMMGNVDGVNYAEWLKPLKLAMDEFGINTPQSIAAFLAQVRMESGGLSKTVEDIVRIDGSSLTIQTLLIDGVANLLRNYSPAFGPTTKYSHTPDEYNRTDRPKEINAKVFMMEKIVRDVYHIDIKNVDAIFRRSETTWSPSDKADVDSFLSQKITWNQAAIKMVASRVYSSDKGNPLGTAGNPLANGDEASGDGYKYLGRGIKQLTGKSNTEGFIGYVSEHLIDGQKTDADIRGNINLIATDKFLAARSAAWFWHKTSGDLNKVAVDLKLIDSATERTIIDKITKAVVGNPGQVVYDTRWGFYTDIAKLITDGGNPYENIQEALQRLGIKAVNPTVAKEIKDHSNGYQTKFGISLRPPTTLPVPIAGGGHLLEADSVSNANLNTQATEPDALQVLLQKFQSEFNIPLGEIDMLMIDMPNVQTQSAPIVMVAQNNQVKQPSNKSGHIMGVCKAVDSSSYTNERGEIYYRTQVGASPESDAALYIEKYEHRYGYRGLDGSPVKVTILKEPKHGKLLYGEVESDNFDRYEADIGYEGEDFASVQVEIKDMKVKVFYYFKIHAAEPPDFQSLMCGDQWTWKISIAPNAGPMVIGLDSDIATLTDGTYSLSLPEAFAGYDYTSPAVTFANLTGAAVGETKGEGANAAITLDTDAAGHGWYIDYTPYLNEDFLPTSNSNEWVAKAGSDAAGKMDLLSVLLHEYGHALGLEHSADAHDFMGTTLTPGTRRLPSADELTLMAQLVADAKQNLAGLDGATVSGTNPTPSPIPTLPLGAGFGITFLGLTRRNNNSTAGLFGEDVAANAPAQYDIAANPTLVNSDLNSADGWTSTGNVVVNPSAGSGQAGSAAVLSETATSQTRLNQVFVLGEHDRFLSFTLANSALGDQATGPDDAFEVALLDANTGLSLLGATGLTRNDAFLNLQANGEEHYASGITRINNADGSRTYLVDLGGIAASTAVNLSFDLIGFGQGSEAGNSQITVRDLRLGVPQTADDNVTLAEDTPTVIDALANDINALQPGFVPVIVNAPSHGQVAINADGSFSFTPESDWYGEDSFSYKLNDSHVDSNLATVTLTVTPVNDAPVATDTALTLAEDATGMIDLLSPVNDVEGDRLVSAIVNGPAHGSLSQNTDGSWIYTPVANYNGSDSFTYKVNDGALDSNLATVLLTVTPVNDAPTTGDQSLSTDEDTPISGSLLPVAADIDSAQLQGSIVAGPQHGQVSVATDGSFTYLADANYNGADSFTYKVNDGQLDSSIATVSLVMNAVNDAPTAGDQSLTTDEDTPITGSLLAVAADIDSALLQGRIVAGPQHGQVTVASDGSFTYLADANDNGADSFTYKVNDGELDSAIATVMLTIVPVNDAPTAGDQQLTTDEDTSIIGSLLAVAVDIDSALLQGSIVIGPQHGQVSVAADGSFTYTADANYNGTDSFTYKVNDGELDSAIATVMLTIIPVNDAPVASTIAATLLEDGRITLNLFDSGSDVDGDPLSVSVGNPQHGQLLKNADGSYTYFAQADYNGEDSFSYSVSDGQLDSGSAMVRLTLTAVNDAPVAQDDMVTLDEDRSIQLAIMANDYDVDGDSLNLMIVSQPAHGTLVVNADHTVSYTPTENWSGEDSFSYKLNDNNPSTLLRTGLDSGIATVRLIIAAVADVPTLVLSEVGGASRELFRTGWESVGNRNTNSTLLEQRELEGWTFVTRPEQNRDDHDDSHDDHGSFEIWSSGDKMADAQHKRRIVNAASGNGSNWFELNDAKDEARPESSRRGHETLGIERSIETVAGASYSLSLDLAGHLGYSADYTRIGIYLDGVKIGTDDSTSPSIALNWQTRTFQFTGTGGAQTLRIVSEANRRESNGRGMMIDNIALTETLQSNTGFEDSAIPLSAIGGMLRDTDGSETLTLTIGAIPLGAILTDGVNSFTASQDNTMADVTGWNLSKLTIMPPKNFNGQFALKIVATSTEQANQSQASIEADILVTVLPVNDAPLASNARYTLSEGGSIVIDFAGLIGDVDVDGDVLALSLTNPKNGKLTKNADGTYTYTPKHEFAGTETFTYTVSDGKLTTTAIITLTVLPKKDHDDNGLHQGFEHSAHNGYQGYDDERCAKIIVQSVHADYGQQHDDRQDAVIDNQNSSRTGDKINWAGQSPNLGKLKKDDWVAQMMTIQPKEQSLAELTGLVVRMMK